MRVLGSNLDALRAQTQLAKSTDKLGQVSVRLASGQRINHASDDAAGLAIATSLGTKRRVYTQSIRNVNDAVSALAIADGASAAITDVIGRLRELATQAANGIYSDEQRKGLDAEAQSLRNEFNRITSSTSFNGLNLFDSSLGHIRIQAGINTDAGALYIDPSSLATGHIGTGSFEAMHTINLGIATETTRAADVNGDGITDLISLNHDSGQGVVQIGDGIGNFAISQSFNSPLASGLEDLQLADLNNDGIQDMVIAGGTEYVSYLGNGDGTFTQGTYSGIPAGAGASRTIALADFNEDGIIDLAAGDNNGFAIYQGQGNGSFDSGVYYQSTGAPLDVSSIRVGDMNSDGHLDVVVNGDGYPNVFLSFGNGDGSFAAAEELFINGGINLAGINIADLNSDGSLDLVVSNNGGHFVMLNDGSGNFSGGNSAENLSAAIQVVAGDLNGDGVIDLIGTDGNSAEVALGNGDGTFQAGVLLSGNGYGINPVLADLNGDSVLDFITSNDVNGITINLAVADEASTLDSISLLTRGGAYGAIRMLDNTLEAIGQARARMGADQSRLSAALNVLTVGRENFAAAQGRIEDADIASEAAAMLQFQILQQTAAQVLKLASVQPEIALNLIGA